MYTVYYVLWYYILYAYGRQPVAFSVLVNWLLSNPQHDQQSDFSLRKADKKSKKKKIFGYPLDF